MTDNWRFYRFLELRLDHDIYLQLRIMNMMIVMMMWRMLDDVVDDVG